MAAFFLDKNVSMRIEEALRRRGHVVTTTLAEGGQGAPHLMLLLDAAERNWTLVTHNRRDFRLLHDAWLRWSHAWEVHRPHAGIVVVEPAPRRSPENVGSLIEALGHDPQTDLTSALYDWKSVTGWIRFPG